MNEDIDIISRTAWAEGRSHGLDGMAAVINVIANRAAEPGWWGKDMRSVCLAKQQFSCWNANDQQAKIIRKVNLADALFFDATMLATAAVNGKLRDRTNGATHYYAEYIAPPKWAVGHKPTLIIGPKGQRHLFFRIGPNA